MASTTVILQAHLDLAGISNAALVAALLGQTVAAAAETFLISFQLAIAQAALKRNGVIRYTLEGQSTEFDITQAQAVVGFLQRMKSDGRGGLAIPVRFT